MQHINHKLHVQHVDDLKDFESPTGITEISIDGDGRIFGLPVSLRRFTRLKKLKVRTTRGWLVNCKNIPPSVVVLDVQDLGNVTTEFFSGFDKLINLAVFRIDSDFLGKFTVTEYAQAKADDAYLDATIIRMEDEPPVNRSDYDPADYTDTVVLSDTHGMFELPAMKKLKRLDVTCGNGFIKDYVPTHIVKHNFFNKIRHRVKNVYMNKDKDATENNTGCITCKLSKKTVSDSGRFMLRCDKKIDHHTSKPVALSITKLNKS